MTRDDSGIICNMKYVIYDIHCGLSEVIFAHCNVVVPKKTSYYDIFKLLYLIYWLEYFIHLTQCSKIYFKINHVMNMTYFYHYTSIYKLMTMMVHVTQNT